MTLGPLIGEAFEQAEVTLDVYTLTSEIPRLAHPLQAERIRAGVIAPQRIVLRMLLPSAEESVLPYPRGRDRRGRSDPARPTPQDHPSAHRFAARRVLEQLTIEKLVPDIELKVRHAPLTPTFKLYLINGVEALHGLYR